MKPVGIRKASLQEARELVHKIAGKDVDDDKIIEEALRTYSECLQHLTKPPRMAFVIDLAPIKRRLLA